jgi:hypothetical protein
VLVEKLDSGWHIFQKRGQMRSGQDQAGQVRASDQVALFYAAVGHLQIDYRCKTGARVHMSHLGATGPNFQRFRRGNKGNCSRIEIIDRMF